MDGNDFFTPFSGRINEYALVATYSLVALLVFILYVWCTAINPADPGIISKFNGGTNEFDIKHGLSMKDLSGKFDELGNGLHSSPSTVSRSSIQALYSSKKGSVGDNGIVDAPTQPAMRKSYCIGGIFCALFVHEDCRKQEAAAEQGSEDALFYTLCNAEWLNNCVRHKNYVTFISLTAVSVAWLVMEAVDGIVVSVCCFFNKKGMETEIVDRLENGFLMPHLQQLWLYVTQFLSWLVYPWGIKTYEYVVAMRAMSQAPAGASLDEELPNVMYSPTRSAITGLSGGSSLGLQYKGAWCTPPRVFVDYQDEVVPHLEPGMVPSTVDPYATGFAKRGDKRPKRTVHISAWKLAKLDSNDAMRAAARARASLSVLQPLDNRCSADPGSSSSGSMGIRSSVSTKAGGNNIKSDHRLSPLGNSFAPSQGSCDEYEIRNQSVSGFSSPSHIHELVTLCPLPQGRVALDLPRESR